jgi:hypothetical protein
MRDESGQQGPGRFRPKDNRDSESKPMLPSVPAKSGKLARASLTPKLSKSESLVYRAQGYCVALQLSLFFQSASSTRNFFILTRGHTCD